jgi:hypothetical protein
MVFKLDLATNFFGNSLVNTEYVLQTFPESLREYCQTWHKLLSMASFASSLGYGRFFNSHLIFALATACSTH